MAVTPKRLWEVGAAALALAVAGVVTGSGRGRYCASGRVVWKDSGKG